MTAPTVTRLEQLIDPHLRRAIQVMADKPCLWDAAVVSWLLGFGPLKKRARSVKPALLEAHPEIPGASSAGAIGRVIVEGCNDNEAFGRANGYLAQNRSIRAVEIWREGRYVGKLHQPITLGSLRFA